MTNWAENRRLSERLSWSSTAERCSFIFDGIESKTFGGKTVYRWVHKSQPIALFITTDDSPADIIVPGDKEPRRIRKHELIEMFLAEGDPGLATSILKSWNTDVLDEIRTLVPSSLDYLDEIELRIDKLLGANPVVVERVKKQVISSIIDSQVAEIMDEIPLEEPALLPISFTAGEFLEIEFTDSGFLVDELMKFGTNVHLVASAKTGKTSLIFALIKSLADGNPFLGEFEIREMEGRIAFLDFEMEKSMSQSWLRRLDLFNTEKVELYPFRGFANPFTNQRSLERLAKDLKDKEIEFLIVDPLSSIYVGNPNDNGEMKAFLLGLDNLKTMSGVKHLLLAVHAGRDAGKTRGASTLDDHPDALWYLSKDSLDVRFFKAIGRDVNLDEGELAFSASNGEFRFNRGVGKGNATSQLESQILKVVTENPGISARELDAKVKGNKDLKPKVRAALVERGSLVLTLGQGSAKTYEVPSL